MSGHTFDLISDLNLQVDESFDWELRATSDVCVVAGNISHDLETCKKVLDHLGEHYECVFFIDGPLENSRTPNSQVVEVFTQFSETRDNIVYLHDDYAISDKVAIIGANGWYGNSTEIDTMYEDVAFLHDTIKELNTACDVESIVVVTSTPPAKELLDTVPSNLSPISPITVLASDQHNKVKIWAYGGTAHKKNATSGGVELVSNPKQHSVYYAECCFID